MFNIYEDSPEEIIDATLSDPALLSYIYKGMSFRDRIVSEVNRTTVIRSKSVNIRDYAGGLMFEEARTRLYYTIRSLQEFKHEGKLDEKAYKELPESLKELIEADRDNLESAYHEADYTIVEQVMQGEFNKIVVQDYLELINLGHFQLSNEKINKLIEYYNSNVAPSDRVTSVKEIRPPKKLQISRLTDYITFIKPTVKEKFIG